MKKFLPFLAVIVLGACAGNPPDWWNPSGMYGTQGTQTQKTTAQKSAVPTVRSAKTEEIPAEESIETTTDEYEEMSLTDAAGENDAQAAESELSAEDAGEQADPMYAAETEDFSAHDPLPPPTVLQ